MLKTLLIPLVVGLCVIHFGFSQFQKSGFKKESSSMFKAFSCKRPTKCYDSSRDDHKSDLTVFQTQFCPKESTYVCIAEYAAQCMPPEEYNNLLITMLQKQRLSMCTAGPYTQENLNHVQCIRYAKPYYSYSCLLNTSDHGKNGKQPRSDRLNIYVGCMSQLIEHICGASTKQFLLDYIDNSTIMNYPEFEEPDERSSKIIQDLQESVGPEYKIVLRYNNNYDTKKN